MNKKDLLKEIEEFKKEQSQPADQSILDEIEAFKEENRRKMTPQVAKAVYDETIEGKYLQPIYDVAEPIIKGASILEKPLSVAMGAGRSVGKLISGQEDPAGPIKEELSSPFPTPAGSLMADFREADIGTEGFLEGALPESVKAQFPKASAFVEGFAPTDAAEMAVSAGLGSQIPGMAGAKRAEMIADDAGIAKKALIRGSQRDTKFVGELQSSGKLDSLASKVISDSALRKNLTNPEKMVEYLQGASREVTNPVTGQRQKIPFRQGKLSQVGGDLSNSIKAFDKKLNSQGARFDVNSFTNDIVDELMDESAKIGSGTDFDATKIRSEVEKYTKALEPSSLQNIDLNRRSYSDLVELKRGAADRVFDMKRAGFANVDNPTIAEQVAQKVWSRADNEINKIADAMQDYDVIKLNNEFSDYQKIRELYANKDIATKYVPTLLEDLLPMGAIGAGATLATGSPYMGLLAAGGYPMARGAVASSATDFPARALNTRMGMIEPGLNMMSKANPAAMATALAAYQIPRNTDQIMQDSDMFIAKLTQQLRTPEDKMIFDEVANTLQNNPDQLSSLMPLLLTKYPSLFAPDKYNRINGRVDPMMKPKAIEDVVKSKSGSALERANKAERLINDNILED